jgi:hypothetical protein
VKLDAQGNIRSLTRFAEGRMSEQIKNENIRNGLKIGTENQYLIGLRTELEK